MKLSNYNFIAHTPLWQLDICSYFRIFLPSVSLTTHRCTFVSFSTWKNSIILVVLQKGWYAPWKASKRGKCFVPVLLPQKDHDLGTTVAIGYVLPRFCELVFASYDRLEHVFSFFFFAILLLILVQCFRQIRRHLGQLDKECWPLAVTFLILRKMGSQSLAYLLDSSLSLLQ